jgi:hypothetical protein
MSRSLVCASRELSFLVQQMRCTLTEAYRKTNTYISILVAFVAGCAMQICWPDRSRALPYYARSAKRFSSFCRVSRAILSLVTSYTSSMSSAAAMLQAHRPAQLSNGSGGAGGRSVRPLPSPVPQLNGKRRALDFEPDPVDDDGDAKSDSPVSALDTDSLPSGADNRKVTIRTDPPLARSPKTHLTRCFH